LAESFAQAIVLGLGAMVTSPKPWAAMPRRMRRLASILDVQD